jgi:hypothetical protein
MTPVKSSACSQKLTTDTNPDQMNPAHTFPSYFNIILPSMPRCSKWFLSFRFVFQDFACISLPSHAHWQEIQITKLPMKHIYPDSCYFLPLTSKYSPILFSETPSVYVLSLMWKTTFHTHTIQQAKLYSFVYFRLVKFLISGREVDSELNGTRNSPNLICP